MGWPNIYGEPTRPPAIALARAPPREDAPVELEPGYEPLAQPESEMEFDQRIHFDALERFAKLVSVYMQAPLLYARDRYDIEGRAGFPTLPG